MNLGTKKIGFIGAGNMGSAIISALAIHFPCENIHIYDQDPSKTETISDKFKINIDDSAKSLVENCSIIILAVKPNIVGKVLKDIKESIKDQTIISLAAGISINSMEEIIGSKKIIRIMPNTPALIGEGMSVLSINDQVDKATEDEVNLIFSYAGKTITLPEKLMDAVTGVSGSGPAYVFTFIQAMTDGAVKMGIPRDAALTLVTQTIIGAAKMVIESNDNPISLRGNVTSPGGTTIAAVHTLEKNGFSGIIMDAIETATLKSEELGKK